MTDRSQRARPTIPTGGDDDCPTGTPVASRTAMVGCLTTAVKLATSLVALATWYFDAVSSLPPETSRLLMAGVAGLCVVWALAARPAASESRFDTVVHGAAAVAVARYGFRCFSTGGDALVVMLLLQIFVAGALTALVSSVGLRLFGARASAPASWALWTRRLNALGVAAPFAASAVLLSANWDLAGVIVILVGAVGATLAFAGSATCTVLAARAAEPPPRRRFAAVLAVSIAFVTAYVVVAVERYPVSASLQRAVEARSGTEVPVDVQQVAALSPADVRAMRASTGELQYWGAYCCIPSPDRERLAYVRADSGIETIYVGDQPMGAFTFRHQMAFSPDGRHFAAIGRVRVDAKPVLYIDGQALANAAPGAVRFLFSPDSQRLIHIAKPSEQSRRTIAFLGSLSVDGNRPTFGDPHQIAEGEDVQPSSFAFSADGAHVLFVDGPEIVRDAVGAYAQLKYYAVVDRERFLVATRPPDDDSGSPIVAFSDRGPYVCSFRSSEDGSGDGRYVDRRVMDFAGNDVDGDPTELCHPPLLQPASSAPPSPDILEAAWRLGDHRARVERRGVLGRLVVDERPHRLFDMIWVPWITPDGREIGYGAVDGDRMVWVRATP